jgi:microcystin-dependent protein
MKKLNLIFTVILLSIMLFGMAQETPRGFNFQAVARNDDGSPKANSSIDIVFGIYPDNASIIPLYKETHTVTTDQFGVFSATIGNGLPETGVFSELAFQNYDCELAVWQLDGAAEVLITRTRLLSVPYSKTALHSINADTAAHAQYASQAFFPAGMVVPFAGPAENVPAGWMLCNGSAVSRTDYANLFSAIGTAWGSGDGSTTFNVPDLRGVFLRGSDETRGLDPDKNARTALKSGGNTGNNVGSYQADVFGSHSHSFLINDNSWPDSWNDNQEDREWNSIWGKDETITTSQAGGNETRPKNVYVNYLIKL